MKTSPPGSSGTSPNVRRNGTAGRPKPGSDRFVQTQALWTIRFSAPLLGALTGRPRLDARKAGETGRTSH